MPGEAVCEEKYNSLKTTTRVKNKLKASKKTKKAIADNYYK